MEFIPIASLAPTTPPPPSKSILGVVTLVWPYSSSTRQCALLLADPDFRLRTRNGQVRVRFTGPSADAVARTRVGIGEEVVLDLDGARWEEDTEKSRTPGRSVDGELMFGQQVRVRIVRGEGDVKVDVDAPLSPPRMSVMQEGMATPAPKSNVGARANLGGGVRGVGIYASPAFAKRLRLEQEASVDPAYDPFWEDGLEEQPNKKQRTIFGRELKWRYTEKSPSPETNDQGAVQPEDAETGVPNGIVAEESILAEPNARTIPAMPPPQLPSLSLSTVGPVKELDSTDQPSTPKIQPVESSTLPLPSPFPTTAPQSQLDLLQSSQAQASEHFDLPSTSKIAPVQIDETGPAARLDVEDEVMLDAETSAEGSTALTDALNAERRERIEERVVGQHDGPDAETSANLDKEVEAVDDYSIGIEYDRQFEHVILYKRGGELYQRLSNETRAFEQEASQPQVEVEGREEQVAQLPETPKKDIRKLLPLDSSLDGTTSAPPSVEVTPKSEKDKLMAKTFRSLFGFQSPEKSPAPQSQQISEEPAELKPGIPTPGFGFLGDGQLDLSAPGGVLEDIEPSVETVEGASQLTGERERADEDRTTAQSLAVQQMPAPASVQTTEVPTQPSDENEAFRNNDTITQQSPVLQAPGSLSSQPEPSRTGELDSSASAEQKEVVPSHVVNIEVPKKTFDTHEVQDSQEGSETQHIPEISMKINDELEVHYPEVAVRESDTQQMAVPLAGPSGVETAGPFSVSMSSSEIGPIRDLVIPDSQEVTQTQGEAMRQMPQHGMEPATVIEIGSSSPEQHAFRVPVSDVGEQLVEAPVERDVLEDFIEMSQFENGLPVSELLPETSGFSDEQMEDVGLASETLDLLQSQSQEAESSLPPYHVDAELRKDVRNPTPDVTAEELPAAEAHLELQFGISGHLQDVVVEEQSIMRPDSIPTREEPSQMRQAAVSPSPGPIVEETPQPDAIDAIYESMVEEGSRPPGLAPASQSVPSQSESEDPLTQIPYHAPETPVYPSVPLSPSNSQSLQDVQLQTAVEALRPQMLRNMLPPTPQLSQIEEEHPALAEPPMSQQDQSDPISQPQVADGEVFTAGDQMQEEQITPLREVDGDAPSEVISLRQPEEVLLSPQANDEMIQDDQSSLHFQIQMLNEKQLSPPHEAIQKDASLQSPYVAPQESLDPDIAAVPPSSQAAETSEELVTPKPQTKRSSKKSLSTRISNVPAVISDWFTPRRSSRLSKRDTDATATSPSRQPSNTEQVTGTAYASSNGYTLAHAHQTSEQDGHRNGLSTPMSYFTPLSRLEELTNLSSQVASGGGAVDVFGVATDQTKEPARAKGGPRDYFTVFRVSDTSISTAKAVRVEVYRPWMATLPVAHMGDVVLLRGFIVKSRKREPYLLSTDASAWCVWRYEDDAALDKENTPIRTRAQSRNSALGSGAREEIKGPPLELGDEEKAHAKLLREWWLSRSA